MEPQTVHEMQNIATMATHSSILAWRIAWTEEPGGLYSPWGRKELEMTNTHTFQLHGWGVTVATQDRIVTEFSLCLIFFCDLVQSYSLCTIYRLNKYCGSG